MFLLDKMSFFFVCFVLYCQSKTSACKSNAKFQRKPACEIKIDEEWKDNLPHVLYNTVTFMELKIYPQVLIYTRQT